MKRNILSKNRLLSGAKKTLLSAGALLLLASVVSCNKFLSKDPYNQVDDSKAIYNYSSAKYALYGTYNSLQSYMYYGRNQIVAGDVATENGIISPNNSNRFIAQAQWSVTAATADVRDFWSKAYEAINQSNKILEAVAGLDMTEAEKATITAQALTLRALCHFDLVKYFAQTYKDNGDKPGVPYMKHSIIYDKPARNTVQEVYAYVIKDLEDAITAYAKASMPASDFEQPYYINVWAAKAILARVYMTQLDYGKALPILQDIVEYSGYKPLDAEKYLTAWYGAHASLGKVEFIFSIRNTPDDYGATSALGYIYAQAGYGDIRVPEPLQALYTPTDIRRKVLFIQGTGTQTDWTFMNKYAGYSNTTGLCDVPVVRLSDVYLMYAEACAYTNDKDNAIKYLDEIRLRADATAVATPETISFDDLKAAIFLERRKELAYEGHYLFDLKRYQMDINSGYRSNGTFYTTITYPSDKLAMPIPQSEIDANGNIKQNPGY